MREGACKLSSSHARKSSKAFLGIQEKVAPWKWDLTNLLTSVFVFSGCAVDIFQKFSKPGFSITAKPLEMRCTSEVSSHDFLGLKRESSHVTTIRKFINAEDVTSGCEKLYKKGSMWRMMNSSRWKPHTNKLFQNQSHEFWFLHAQRWCYKKTNIF